MAIWVILIGAVVMVAILGVALFLVFAFTREGDGATPLRRFRRFRVAEPVEIGAPRVDPPA
jgi:hypothetical protein